MKDSIQSTLVTTKYNQSTGLHTLVKQLMIMIGSCIFESQNKNLCCRNELEE